MVYIFIALIYLSVLCWAWGHLLIRLFTRISSAGEAGTQSFSIVCFTGLSVIAVISGLLSLCMALGGIAAQLVLLIPAALTMMSKGVRLQLTGSLKELLCGYLPATALLAICLLILLIILGASVISHPDSIGYHLQTIQWIEQYRVVPGLVNINTHLGYQGLWYCLCAVFSFRFLHTSSVTSINTVVLVWYVLFVLGEINRLLPNRKVSMHGSLAAAFLYFLLLGFSCWSYVQVRLTATSVSPDFIAALYVWLIFFLLTRDDSNRKNTVNYLLIAFLCGTAITIKLSAAPVVIIIVYVIYKLVHFKQTTAIVTLLVCGLFTAIPFIARNVITSGYALYPAAFPDLVQADWKLPLAAAIADKEYISSFARVEHVKVASSSPAAIQTWLPVWWQHRALSDKIILCSLLFLLLIAIATTGKIKKTASRDFIFALFISFAALIFWFVQAPDPRFGFGFIIPVQGMLSYFYLSAAINKLPWLRTWLLGSMAAFGIVILAYSVHRVTNYFDAQYILSPAGAQQVVYKSIQCGKFTFTMPVNGGCGDAPLPCIYTDCSHFAARGNSITDGFKYQ